MEFHGIRFINIEQLGLSQIYLSSDKIASIEKWFNPQCMDNFQPLSVHAFENNMYTLTDGHTRAYVAFKSGISVLPVVYDNDPIVTSQIGQLLYRADMDWCKRFQLSHIKQLGNRIISKSAYQELWIERCDRSYNLLTQASPQKRIQLQSFAPNLFLYGTSEDMSVLFFENKEGKLFLYRDNALLPEKQLAIQTEIS